MPAPELVSETAPLPPEATSVAVTRPPASTVMLPLAVFTLTRTMASVSVTVMLPAALVTASRLATVVCSVIGPAALAVSTSAVIMLPEGAMVPAESIVTSPRAPALTTS